MKLGTISSITSLLTCVVLTSSLVYSEDNRSPGRNPLLRKYFWDQALRVISVPNSYSARANANPVYLTQRVDQWVDRYLDQVGYDMIALREDFVRVKLIQMEILRNSEAGVRRNELSMELKRLMTQLAERADGLRKDLSGPFSEMRSDDTFEPRIRSQAGGVAFAWEVKFIGEQVANAEKSIKDNLVDPKHTTDFESLAGRENMLTNLYRIQKMARLLEKEIPERGL